jgi:hypothetical protein
MADHTREQDSSHIANVDVDHEEHDVNVRAIVLAGVALIAVAVVVHIAIYGLYLFLEGRTAARLDHTYPLAPAGRQMPREPQLQAMPAAALQNLRREEDAVLTGYAWIDQKAGVTRIPIEEAMKIIVQRGLPARTNASAPASAGAPR